MNFKTISYLFFLFSLSILGQQISNPNIDKHLLNLSSQNKLSSKDIIEYIITDEVTSKNNVTHYYFRQSYKGIEIIGTESSLHVFKNKVVSYSNNFVSDKENILKKEQITHKKAPEAVISSLASKLNYTHFKGVSKKNTTTKNSNVYTSGNTFIYSNGGISKNDIPVKKVYYLNDDKIIISGWELSINETEKDGNWYNYIIKDSSGEVLSKVNWKSECNQINHNHNIIKDHISIKKPKKNKIIEDEDNSYSVFPYPLENPHFGELSKVTLPHNEDASPFGWHDVDGIVGAEYTVTRGNNVSAYEDGDNRGYQPDGGSNLVFNFSFNPTYSSSDQSEDAAITNLFYWNNIIHDVLYQYGFDEESGNFQVKNYTGNGIENDEVLAEAQDNFGTCNAFFSTPPDGINGVMQMFICSDRDGSFDNHVIVHEYVHGLSNRLTGGPSNSDCLRNSEQMGEGWSDWYANMLTMTKDDASTDLRGVGTWLFGEDIDGRGIRDYPYTTDLNEDPRTYNSIKTAVSPHQVGSVWAAMLWELTWALIDKYGFDEDIYNGTGGNNIALALVTEALKLQPCSPGFVDGRDAILTADQILNNGENQCEIWDAFAKRGLGANANQGSSNSVTDGTESFESFSTSFFLSDNSFCELLEPVVLTGGNPTGGIYSGLGVTDNGNGETFTFNPALAGVGTHTITYTTEEISCGINNATVTLEVTDKTPKFETQNITVKLNEENSVSIEPGDVVLGFTTAGTYRIEKDGVFNPENITDKETVLQLGDDSQASNISIGFDFTFFEEQYSKLNISSNGFVSFGENFNSGCCSGQFLPSSSSPNNLIALAWTDLFPNSSNNVSYAMVGEAPNRIFIINYNGIRSGGSGAVTSQLKLFEKNNIIEIHSTSVNGSSMTQGIENKFGDAAYVVEGRNRNTLSLNNDFVAFIPEKGNLPNECGLENIVTLDKNTFDCSDFGENTITATVTDSQGNSSSKEATVTVLPFADIQFTISENEFCKNDEIITDLTGGFPEGGTYSGVGVTDDGNGRTFSLDVTSLGVGKHNITYTQNNSCDSSSQINAEFEIIPVIPDIETQFISTNLDETGSATISLEDIIVNNSASSIYAISNTSGNNIAKYFYNVDTNDINVDSEFPISSTSTDYSFAIDYNSVNKKIYLLAASNTKSLRNLYEIDLENENNLTFIDNIISVNNDTRPQDMAFDKEGLLYFTFKNGEINTYNVESKTMSSFANISGSGSEGLTYDFDNNRLIHTTSNRLSSIDIESKEVTSLFNFSFSCRSQAIEYLGNNKLIASSTSRCNTIYTIDLETEEIEVLQSPSGSFESIKDLLFIENVYTDNCNNEKLNFSIDKEIFSCDDIGENIINITASDNSGNTKVFQTNVEILDFNSINFEMTNTIFCTDEGIISDLGGGYPEGGTYSGAGIIDSDNGINFSIDTSLIEPGIHSISYQFTTICNTLIEKDIEIEILPAIPEISCQNITVELDVNGNAIITSEDLLDFGFRKGTLFAINPFSSSNNIANYFYDLPKDIISIDNTFSKSTNLSLNYALDYNRKDRKTYALAGPDKNTRNLYEIDLETENDLLLIGQIVSVNGDINPQDMTFDNDGNLYFIFKSGEINKYNLKTKTLSEFANITGSGSEGITFDFDNNRLIHVSRDTFSAIDITSKEVSSLFSLTNTICQSAQAIEYVGNNKIIASGTVGCNTIYTINIETQELQSLLKPSGSFDNIKDLMFINSAIVDNCSNEALTFSLSNDTFTCEDLGENIVTVTANNNRGSSASCSATVTVVEQNNISFEIPNTIFCIDEDIITGLTGGFPTGGVYSGEGVTDDGNGITFSFNPSLLSIGTHNLFYEHTNTCGTVSKTQIEVEVQSAIPDISCQNITIELDDNGNVIITPEQLIGINSNESFLYTLSLNTHTKSITRYLYNPREDEIVFDQDFNITTNVEFNYAFDYNPINRKTYLLSVEDNKTYLNEIDLDSGEVVQLDEIKSLDNSSRALDMAFDKNGVLYFSFFNGEINSYNLETKELSSLTDLNSDTDVLIGMTYNKDNDKLIIDINNRLSEIDTSTGQITSLFSLANSICSESLAIEYVGNNTLIATNYDCNKVYTIDLESKTTNILIDNDTNTADVVDFLFTGQRLVDNCSNEPLTLSLDNTTFNCSNIGENIVTVTASNSRGSSTSCSAIVTVVENNIELNLSETTFCKSADIFTELGGGSPIGGVYSGDGVVDNGNGSTFSLNTSLLEIGNSIVYYEYINDCGSSFRTEVSVEVIPAIPDISYQNITVELDNNGSATITSEDLLNNNFENGNLFAVTTFSNSNNIAKYDYLLNEDNISIDNTFSKSSNLPYNYAIDYDKKNRKTYMLSASNKNIRNLYEIDLETEDNLILIGQIISINGDTRPQDMTFDNNGNLYFTFKNGELNKYDIETKIITEFSNISGTGSEGITFDFDNNRLIHVSRNVFSAVDIDTREVTSLFSLSNTICSSAQAIEYVGNNKLIASGMSSCNTIYTINIESQESNSLLTPSGSFTNIKDLLFMNSTILDNCGHEPLNFSLDKNSFNCSDIGDNTVLVTASDNNGNSSTSEVVISIIDNAPPTIDTVDKLVIDLNIEENRTITLDDILLNGNDNCDEEITYSISKTTFSCEDLKTIFLEDVNIISNGSFEQDSENWTITTNSPASSGSCNIPWKIDTTSSGICCCVENINPTDGSSAMFTSFDSSTEETNYTLSQIIKIPDNLNGKAELSFDWLGNFSLTFGSGTLDRVFTVSLYDENDNLIDVVYSYNIPISEISSINNSVTLDILDTLLPYTGEDIRLEFNAFIPEASTGPGKSLLDNIKLLTQTSSNTFIVTTTATDSSGNVGESNTIIEISEDSCEVLSSSSYEEIQNSIIISPNPANKFVNFSIQNNSFDFVEIYNSNGSLIKKVSIQNRIGKIATKELSTGVYFLKFRRNNMTIVKKFIKIGQD